MKATQRQRLTSLFETNPNTWIPLPRILDMYISQYGTRILELRRGGMKIENKTKAIDGVKHSWFRYVVGDQKKFDF